MSGNGLSHDDLDVETQPAMLDEAQDMFRRMTRLPFLCRARPAGPQGHDPIRGGVLTKGV